MKLCFNKINWNHIQILVEFEKSDGSEEVETVVANYDLEDLENEYFIELLKYLLSYGETEYKTWFEEFIYIPYEDGKPMKVSEVVIRKIENGQCYNVLLVNEITDFINI